MKYFFIFLVQKEEDLGNFTKNGLNSIKNWEN